MTDPAPPLSPGVVLTSRDLAVGSRALDALAGNDPASIGRNSREVAATTSSFADTLARVRAAWAAIAAGNEGTVSDITVDGNMLVPLGFRYDDRLLVATICKAYALDLATALSMSDVDVDDDAGDGALVGELLTLAHRLGAAS